MFILLILLLAFPLTSSSTLCVDFMQDFVLSVHVVSSSPEGGGGGSLTRQDTSVSPKDKTHPLLSTPAFYCYVPFRLLGRVGERRMSLLSHGLIFIKTRFLSLLQSQITNCWCSNGVVVDVNVDIVIW